MREPAEALDQEPGTKQAFENVRGGGGGQKEIAIKLTNVPRMSDWVLTSDIERVCHTQQPSAESFLETEQGDLPHPGALGTVKICKRHAELKMVLL